MAVATGISWREGLDAGDLSAEGLVCAGLHRMDTSEPVLHALLARDAARSLELARTADRRIRAGERGPVLGLPVVLKDNIHWKGVPLTCGSRILEGYTAPYDATVTARLLAAGAIPLAKANMDEFAMGSSGEYSAFGPTRNPWDLSRVPGGSSSGSIVAVAAGYAPLALGSDTGGSVRLPAAFCNVTALRPTYGVLSRYGVTAMASSLDQVGPVAATCEDVAAALSVTAGTDPMDATSRDLPEAGRLWPLAPADLRGLRIGLPREYFGEGLEPGLRQALDAAIDVFRQAGAQLREVTLPHTACAIDAYYLVNTSEVSSNLARFDGLRYGWNPEPDTRSPEPAPEGGATRARSPESTRSAGFGAEAKRRILLGAFGLSKGHYEAFYLKALKARTLVARDFDAAFSEVDVLLAPASPTVAFPLGDKTSDPLAMYLADVFAVAAPLAGLPALALPAGFSSTRGDAEPPCGAGGPPSSRKRLLPVGLQLMGPALSDVRLLEIGHAFQRLTDHHLQSPPFLSGVPHGL